MDNEKELFFTNIDFNDYTTLENKEDLKMIYRTSPGYQFLNTLLG